ncbi:hypothetical protein A4G29_10620 [Mycobacterium kansasii]|nr:hypothetical protein A4G29_10620 [Mycobacterium kansasii]
MGISYRTEVGYGFRTHATARGYPFRRCVNLTVRNALAVRQTVGTPPVQPHGFEPWAAGRFGRPGFSSLQRAPDAMPAGARQRPGS